MSSQKLPYSLFPGQIVAIEGMNTTGRKLTAHKVLDGVAPLQVKTTAQDLLRYHYSPDYQDGQPLKIMVVSGPFTTSDNLDYVPMTDLLFRAQHDQADVVILMGPFVNMQQDQVKSGNLQIDDKIVSYEAFFADKIAGFLEDHYKSTDEACHTQFVLVPSLDDATADWVYPQCPLHDRLSSPVNHKINMTGADEYEFGTLGLHHVEASSRSKTSSAPRRVHCVSNPCTLRINETVVGLTSTDVLFHMNGEETNANLEPGSRLGKISQHMIMQRNYYPLFPPHASVNVDYKFMDRMQMPVKPDLLVLPSKLAPFARVVAESTVVVNPGHLVRGTTGGTFAMVEIHPLARDSLEGANDGELEHGIHERTRVEIIKI
jgi:DNA polymerase alpha subunit B